MVPSYELSPLIANYLFAFYGVLAFTAIVSIIQFYVSRDKAYLFYSFYVSIGFLFYAVWQEANFNYFGFANHPSFELGVSRFAIPVLLTSYILYCFFVINFLSLQEHNPKIKLRFRQIIRTFLIIILIDQVTYLFTRASNPSFGSPIYNVVKSILLFLTVVSCFYAIGLLTRIKQPLARLLLIATGLYFLGSLISLYIFMYGRFNPAFPLSSWHPTFFNQVGFLLEITLFSVGLGYRLKLTENAKEAASQNYIQELKRNQKLELEKNKTDKERELHQERNRFYTNITHEFRTPLTIIMGMADRLESYTQEQKLIIQNSNYLLRLINQILDLSKFESGHLKLNYQQDNI